MSLIIKRFIELSEKYGFDVDPTPGGAHWAGKIVEAQHGTLRRMLSATISDSGCPLEDCLVGCIIATNTMGQVHGYTPDQHAFGKNRSNVDTFSPPSLVDYTSIPMEYQNSITNRLHAMQVTRDVYHKCHTKEQLFRAMRLNTRVVPFKGEIGDKVWFWRDPKLKRGSDMERAGCNLWR